MIHSGVVSRHTHAHSLIASVGRPCLSVLLRNSKRGAQQAIMMLENSGGGTGAVAVVMAPTHSLQCNDNVSAGMLLGEVRDLQEGVSVDDSTQMLVFFFKRITEQLIMRCFVATDNSIHCDRLGSILTNEKCNGT